MIPLFRALKPKADPEAVRAQAAIVSVMAQSVVLELVRAQAAIVSVMAQSVVPEVVRTQAAIVSIMVQPAPAAPLAVLELVYKGAIAYEDRPRTKLSIILEVF
jgi:hypothetical protein